MHYAQSDKGTGIDWFTAWFSHFMADLCRAIEKPHELDFSDRFKLCQRNNDLFREMLKC